MMEMKQLKEYDKNKDINFVKLHDDKLPTYK